MKIAIIFGSHRINGMNSKIEKMIKGLSLNHELDFIHMANSKIEGCISCHYCGKTGKCVLPESSADNFQQIFDRLVVADVIFIITPVYAMIPSRLTALFERLTSVLYDSGVMNTSKNPLLNKKVAIVSYCSNQICDEKELKIIFQKFVMTGYSFTAVNFDYLNNCANPNEIYENVIDYVKDIILHI